MKMGTSSFLVNWGYFLQFTKNQQIQIPVQRFPLKFSDLQSTKASQYRDFLLFYGLHVLQGILPHKYHVHFGLLVRAVYILCQSKITPSEMTTAAWLLDRFYSRVEKYYGRPHCTLNVHNLGTHVVQCVRLAGPLFTHSAFFFESICGDIGAMVTGPRKPVKQIIDGVGCMQEFRTATSIREDFSDEVKLLLQRDRRKLKPLQDNFVSTKRPRERVLTDEEKEAIKCEQSTALELDRVERYGVVFAVQRPTSSQRRKKERKGKEKKEKERRHNDSFVSYQLGEDVFRGVIQSFLITGTKQLATIRPFASDPTPFPFPLTPQRFFDEVGTTREEVRKHMSAVRFQTDILHAVGLPLKDIKRKVVFLPTGSCSGTIIELPSNFEHN